MIKNGAILLLFSTLIILVFWKFFPSATSEMTTKKQETSPLLLSKRKEIEKLLTDAFLPSLLTNRQLEKTNYYSYDVELNQDPWQNITISATPYVKGLKVNQGYEVLSWTKDYDKDLKLFNSLKAGKQMSETLMIGGYEIQEVTLRKIGNNNWAIHDYVFNPSASLHRIYETFDSRLGRFITINYGYSVVDKPKDLVLSKNGKESIVTSVPANFQKNIDVLEDILSNY